MSFAIYLAVSEARGFQYLFDSRNAAEAWFRNELAEISKKKVRKDFSGEIVQTYDLTTEPMSEILLQETSSEAKAADGKAWLADNESRLAVHLCPECDFTAKTKAGLMSHLRHKHIKVDGDSVVPSATVDMRSGKVGYLMANGVVKPVLMEDKAKALAHWDDVPVTPTPGKLDKLDRDLAKLRAQDGAEGVGEDEDVSPLPDVPPCPKPDTCLPGELTKAVQERQFALVADCPFCEEEHTLYDFVDQVTGEVHQACTACWLEVSK